MAPPDKPLLVAKLSPALRRWGFRRTPTPAGVPVRMRSPGSSVIVYEAWTISSTPWHPGDEVTIEIEGIGALTNPFVSG